MTNVALTTTKGTFFKTRANFHLDFRNVVTLRHKGTFMKFEAEREKPNDIPMVISGFNITLNSSSGF